MRFIVFSANLDLFPIIFFYMTCEISILPIPLLFFFLR